MSLEMHTPTFEKTNAAVTTSFSNVGDAAGTPAEQPAINLDGNYKEVAFEVHNATPSIALADFSLQIKAHPNAQWVDFITGTTWESQSGFVKFKSANVNTLAGEAKATVVALIPVCSQIRFQAKAASSTVDVTVRGLCWR